MKGKTATEEMQTRGENSRDFQIGLSHNPTKRSREVWKQKLMPVFISYWLISGTSCNRYGGQGGEMIVMLCAIRYRRRRKI